MPARWTPPAWYEKNVRRGDCPGCVSGSRLADFRLRQRSASRAGSSRGNQSLHAPELLHLEVAQVLRRLVREGTLPTSRAAAAIQDFLDLRITRYPHSLIAAPDLATPPQFVGVRRGVPCARRETWRHLAHARRQTRLCRWPYRNHRSCVMHGRWRFAILSRDLTPAAAPATDRSASLDASA